ncbi:hypothetical protein [Yoonia sediminilitoris]|uniref:Uncharacterized protein n=1 Tax=Yoonia sediminilitoris TaxID=1286148 RepID=A0A2T6KDX0_9RHOB|nr:hypothetical protein [Yoonia sediminilitoris]PUB13208.1 hypothetical protein C8N45_108129 [Yoonia sediminilitoris]RCW94543.1 hypothetical protein DFP92_108130 [Yoonia sediminilitoris]
MIELIFVACLAASPTQCNDQSLLFTDVTPMACMMGAQPQLAKWSSQRPGYTIKSWTCRVVNLAQKDV